MRPLWPSLKTLFGISKGGRAPPAPPLNPLVISIKLLGGGARRTESEFYLCSLSCEDSRTVKQKEKVVTELMQQIIAQTCIATGIFGLKLQKHWAGAPPGITGLPGY